MKVVKYVTAALCLILTAVTLSLLTIQTVDLPKAVEISLTVDREACQPGESVIATLAAQNTGSRGVGDVEMEVLLPDGCTWSAGSPEAEKELWGLESGESASHSVILALPAQEAAESSPGLLERYGLQAEILLLTLGVVGMALLIVFGREHKVLLSALFVSAVFLGLILPFALQGARALFLRDTVRTECVVQLEDREVRLEGKVSYLPQPPAGERPADVYTIIFDVGGGSPVAPQTVEEGGYLSTVEIPTREGYAFAGWYEDRELTKYFTFSENPITKDTILYAMWSEGKEELDSDGDGVSDVVETYYGSDPYTADDVETDTDGDGLVDYLERYVYDSDPNDPDTDKDGLNDYQEAALVETDPTLADTDGDGVGDYDSDQDGDGISNGRELELGTDPLNRDTDSDGLEDGEEVNTHHTDPLSADTDGDGASDGWEVEHGYDPLVYNDSFSVSASAAAQDGAVTAQVSLSCSGDPASLSVEETTQAGLLDSSVPGYVGSAFEFNADVSFESATITFAFDPNAVPEDAELVIYYFNEEKQLLEPLETTVSDGRATAQVTHFSTYILLNKKMMDQVWEKEILAPGSQAYNETVFNIAFVIDYSASMDDNDPEDLRLSIVDQFIGKLRDGQDQASVVKFAAYATTLVPLSTDKEMLSNAVTGITNNSGDGCDNEAGTNGSDGLHAALEQLEGAEGDYKYIIFLTDGEDNKYSYEYTDLIDQAKEEGVVIYSIGMGDADEELLTNIAQSTGGKFYYATAVEMEDVTGEGLMDAFHDIQISTIDFETDSNGDGISDYYTRLLCSGQLRTGTGIALFDGISYEAVQASKDYDGDGVPNGEEVIITHDEESGRTYLMVVSSPILKDTDQDGYGDKEDKNPRDWDVGDRDLAIFAALAYEDGSAFQGKMYTAADIKGTDSEPGERYYFLNGASLAGTDSGIASQWRVVDYVNTWEDIDTYFSATTFKNGNNVVIAYRGTNDGIGEWVNNIVGVGLLNYHSEESAAQQYALKIADAYPDCKIYITGHSLGGYLAQIGATAILKERDVNLAGVVYFNGIGLKYNPILFWSKEDELSYLSAYYKGGSKLISYEIKGDVVSALGQHSGSEISFYACDEARRNHAGKYGGGTLVDFLSKSATGWLCILTWENLATRYEYYGPQSLMEYFWITHETDSFFYYLTQGSRG